jgi:phosphoglycolate phosphatase-like HAD superfamily hydrolase
MDYAEKLKSLPQTKEFLVGIDSDGCVFDTMEIKQKECFCPSFIKHFGLQAASKYARELWLFVNLYSKTRGCNRFLALQRALRLAADWHVFGDRGLDIREIPELNAWIERESKLGNPALEKVVAESGDPALSAVLAWSHEANARIADMVHGVPPFPRVRESLQRLRPCADMLVVSQTPIAALEREWKEHGIDKYVDFIAGQEVGKKSEHLQYANRGRYQPDKILMLGDAPGDLKAAQANEALFFPVIPGREEESWEQFHDEAINRFLDGAYAGQYQAELLNTFAEALPELPPWQS